MHRGPARRAADGAACAVRPGRQAASTESPGSAAGLHFEVEGNRRLQYHGPVLPVNGVFGDEITRGRQRAARPLSTTCSARSNAVSCANAKARSDELRETCNFVNDAVRNRLGVYRKIDCSQNRAAVPPHPGPSEGNVGDPARSALATDSGTIKLQQLNSRLRKSLRMRNPRPLGGFSSAGDPGGADWSATIDSPTTAWTDLTPPESRTVKVGRVGDPDDEFADLPPLLSPARTRPVDVPPDHALTWNSSVKTISQTCVCSPEAPSAALTSSLRPISFNALQGEMARYPCLHVQRV